MTLHPDDYRFTLSEIVGESKYESMSLRNWMARDVISIGQKHKLGRWLFSMADIIRIRIMQSLTEAVSMPPADANRYADIVVERYRYLARPDRSLVTPVTQLQIGSLVGRKTIFVKAGYSIGVPSVAIATYDENNSLKFEHDTISYETMIAANAHLTIPMDEIIGSTVMNFEIDAFEEENGSWNVLPIKEGLSEDDQWQSQRTLDGMIAWYTLSHANGGAPMGPVAKGLIDKIENLTSQINSTPPESFKMADLQRMQAQFESLRKMLEDDAGEK